MTSWLEADSFAAPGGQLTMHFHLPKPLHGWRAFAGEVGVIVLGVLIALAAQPVVEDLSWRERARQATDALRVEIGDHYREAAEFVVAAPCIDRQIDALSAAVAASSPTPARLYGDQMEEQFVVRAPSRPWSENQWNAIREEGAASHLDKDLRAQLGNHYAQIAIMRENNRMADQLVYKLIVLSQPIPLDPATRAHFSEELQELRGRFDYMKLVGGQILARVEQMGFAPPKSYLDERMANSGTLEFCRAHALPLAKIEPQKAS